MKTPDIYMIFEEHKGSGIVSFRPATGGERSGEWELLPNQKLVRMVDAEPLEQRARLAEQSLHLAQDRENWFSPEQVKEIARRWGQVVLGDYDGSTTPALDEVIARVKGAP